MHKSVVVASLAAALSFVTSTPLGLVQEVLTGEARQVEARYVEKPNKAFVRIRNRLPINASFELVHYWTDVIWGGNESRSWRDVKPDARTEKWEISFEDDEDFEHMDYWSVILNFASPGWKILCPLAWNTLHDGDKGKTLDFDIDTSLNTYTSESNFSQAIAIRSPNDFPPLNPGAPDIDSYLFFKVKSNFTEKITDFRAYLNPDEDSPERQDRFFTNINPGEMQNDQALPLFFAKSPPSDYGEKWYFALKTESGTIRRSNKQLCYLRSWLAGEVLTLEVSKTGWRLGYDTIDCRGTWAISNVVADDL